MADLPLIGPTAHVASVSDSETLAASLTLGVYAVIVTVDAAPTVGDSVLIRLGQSLDGGSTFPDAWSVLIDSTTDIGQVIQSDPIAVADDTFARLYRDSTIVTDPIAFHFAIVKLGVLAP